MSILKEFRDTEALVEELKVKLQKMANDDQLKVELEFSDKLRALMGQYGKSLRDIIQILSPSPAKAAVAQPTQRRERSTKVYKHAETGEILEIKSSNNKVFKAWNDQYGAAVVAGWLQS